MPSLNSAQLMGNLTDAPKISYGQGQDAKAVAHFTLAVKRRHAKDDSSDFISCVAFGKTAEFIGKYFIKGDSAIIKGEIRTGDYTNKDGVKVYTTEVVVDDVEFGENKSQRDTRRQNQPQAPQQMPQGYPQQMPQQGYPQQMPQGQPAQQMAPQQMPQGQPVPQQVAPQQQVPPQSMPPQGMPPQGGAPFGAPANWNFQ